MATAICNYTTGFTQAELWACVPTLGKRARLFTMRSEYEAEDLVQDTLMRAWAKRDLYHGGSLIAWCIMIMRRLFFNHCRSSTWPKNMPLDDRHDSGTVPPELQIAPSAENIVLAKECIDLCNSLLKENQRAVLMAALDGREKHEIAAELGIPPMTAGTRLYYGRKRLRQEVLGEAPDPRDCYR